ncbi:MULTISPECIES: hypothetical protein [Acinetobacter]|jgi:hypothetical protein|uniref:Uncharacterized protein n=1 Tax=Acinetobacter towneri TaxID=202956 RepID=A0AB35M0T4_9GAMM|nr:MULTISPECIES: hypothetical protein [Acinetobacter]MCA4789138.1 hypothetical protein [Acinetobacter towneri]MCA4797435.1 hypothetical protein [Acinetobacter towneri]MCA4813698.1 hypothetical protein [Acinetobacter towneri]MCO8046793.1 hypothetical protein [Acinetobacter towneri]MCO8053711.1 hypothetical protein [Acinetobacter towneri]
MAKLLLWILLLIAVYAVWKVWFKIKINRTFQQSCQDIANIVQDPITHKAPRPVEEVVEEVAEYEQQLFDDIAEIFLSLKVSSRDPEDAETIQQEVLNKMPAKAHTQIRQLDLGEWSIYWSFYEQSLEYFVGKYGVFITHVDRFGQEHKYNNSEQFQTD